MWFSPNNVYLRRATCLCQIKPNDNVEKFIDMIGHTHKQKRSASFRAVYCDFKKKDVLMVGSFAGRREGKHFLYKGVQPYSICKRDSTFLLWKEHLFYWLRVHWLDQCYQGLWFSTSCVGQTTNCTIGFVASDGTWIIHTIRAMKSLLNLSWFCMWSCFVLNCLVCRWIQMAKVDFQGTEISVDSYNDNKCCECCSAGFQSFLMSSKERKSR